MLNLPSFKSDFVKFMKNFFYFLILFSICFYILLYINKNTSNNLILIESKIFFYIIIIFLFMVINNILETPLDSLKKFILIIISSLLISYIINFVIMKYYNNDNFYTKFFISMAVVFVVFIIASLIIFFTFEKKNKLVSSQLYETFNIAIKKNMRVMICFAIYFYIIYYIFSFMKLNSSVSDIFIPSIIGCFLIFFIFCFLIYICHEMKIINNLQYLNTFIVLASLSFYFVLCGIYIFMNGLESICTDNSSKEDLNNQEFLSIIIICSILIILWYDDSRNWHQIGYLLFLIVTLVAFICFFYFTQKYPNIGTLSAWLLIEWLIIVFYQKRDARNSIHYVFMKT